MGEAVYSSCHPLGHNQLDVIMYRGGLFIQWNLHIVVTLRT